MKKDDLIIVSGGFLLFIFGMWFGCWSLGCANGMARKYYNNGPHECIEVK